MILVVTSAGFGLLSLPALMHKLGRRLQPQLWALLCTLALLSGALLIIASVLLIAVPPACDSVGLWRLAHNCERMLGSLYPGGVVASAISIATLVSALCISTRVIVRAQHSAHRARSGLMSGTCVGRRGHFDVVVVPDDRRYALSVPTGRGGGQMLISRGVVNALDDAELELVCAHEEAHLRFKHRRFLLLAQVVEEVFWFWPPTKSSASILRLALERWADEVAAGCSEESRRRLQTTLLTVAGVTAEPGLAAFSAIDGLMDRLDALDHDPRPAHLGWWLLAGAPGLAIGVIAALVGNRLGHQAYCLIAMSGHCPLG
jgi:beta-lactamase regulating signal transducer with metallopeptidase domain